ncbi:MAG: STAS domain-containing protein [Thermodesulfobacteriota bacterium]
MRIDTRKSDDLLIITPLDNRIDASIAPDFKGHILNWINEGNHRILLDLYHVEFIDSSGLSVLVSTLKALGGTGEFMLCSICATVMNLFRLTRMDRIFKIYPSVEEALKAVKENQQAA